jgi:hypothetical protein
MKKTQSLVKLMKNKYNVNLDINSFQRIRAGYYQRSLGAWSWSMQYLTDIPCSFGSQDSITEILKNKSKIKIYENEIIIEHNTK